VAGSAVDDVLFKRSLPLLPEPNLHCENNMIAD
jgi:hypothetical protein